MTDSRLPLCTQRCPHEHEGNCCDRGQGGAYSAGKNGAEQTYLTTNIYQNQNVVNTLQTFQKWAEVTAVSLVFVWAPLRAKGQTRIRQLFVVLMRTTPCRIDTFQFSFNADCAYIEAQCLKVRHTIVICLCRKMASSTCTYCDEHLFQESGPFCIRRGGASFVHVWPWFCTCLT